MSLFLRSLGGSVLFLLVACDFAGDPDRFVNERARPPVLVEATDFSSIAAGEHLTGFIPVELTLDSLAGRVEEVILRFEGGQWSDYRSQPPYRFTVPALFEEEGSTTLLAEIYLRDVDHGLLDLGNPPSVRIGTPVVIDHRPPTPVEARVDRWDDDGVTLSWTANTDPNFYAYTVTRTDAWTQPDDPWNGSFGGTTVLDSLFDAGVQSFVDPLPPVVGLSASYAVTATNRAEASPRISAQADYGTPASLRADHLRQLLFHPTRAEAYSTDGLSVAAHATTDAAFLWQRDLLTVVEMGYLMGARLAGVTADGDELVLYADGLNTDTDQQVGEAVFLSVQNPTAARRWELPAGVRALQVGPPGRLYGRTDTGRLLVLDADSGAEIASLEGVPTTGLFRVLPDRTTLLFVRQNINMQCDLITVDAGGTPVLLAETPLPESIWGCAHVRASEDADELFVVDRGDATIDVLDARTHDRLRSTTVPLPAPSEVRGVDRRGDRLYLALDVREPTVPYVQGEVIAVGGADLDVRARWAVAAPVEDVRADPLTGDLFTETGIGPIGLSHRFWRLSLSR
jgi:hypothetical protein